MEVCKDAADPSNFNQPPEKITQGQLVIAVYESVFQCTIDDLLVSKGHEPMMKRVPASEMEAVMVRFAQASEPEDLYKMLCKELSLIPTYDKNKLAYLREPVNVGMIIAKQIFRVDKKS